MTDSRATEKSATHSECWLVYLEFCMRDQARGREMAEVPRAAQTPTSINPMARAMPVAVWTCPHVSQRPAGVCERPGAVAIFVGLCLNVFNLLCERLFEARRAIVLARSVRCAAFSASGVKSVSPVLGNRVLEKFGQERGGGDFHWPMILRKEKALFFGRSLVRIVLSGCGCLLKRVGRNLVLMSAGGMQTIDQGAL